MLAVVFIMRRLFLLDWAFEDHVLCAWNEARIQGYNSEGEKAMSIQSLPFTGGNSRPVMLPS